MSKSVCVKGTTKRLRDDMLEGVKGKMLLSIGTYADLDDLDALEMRVFDGTLYDAMLRASMQHMLARGNGVMVLARDKSGMLRGYGLALFKRNSDKARFASLAVDVNAQGLGIGTQLFAAIETISRAAGAKELLLEIRADNHRLRASYEKKGYRAIREEAYYYPDGCACLKMAGLL